MANFPEFLKKHLTATIVIGVAAVALIGAGVTMIVDRASYAAYEQAYNDQKASFPVVPEDAIMDNDYVVYNQAGDGIVSTKSQYKKAFIYYARDAVIAPLSQDVSAEYAKTDDSMLGEYITGLDRRGGAITFTFRTPTYGYADIDIPMKTNWVDENGIYHELGNLTDYIKIQTNGLGVITQNVKLEVSDNWSHLVLKNAFLLKGENTLTFTTSAYNDFGNKDNVLYIMPNIRNVTVLTNVDVYQPEFELDTKEFKTDYRLVEMPDLSKIKVIKKVGDPNVSYYEEELTADKLQSSIDYDGGKIVIKCSAKVTKEVKINIDKSAAKNTITGTLNDKPVTIVVTAKDKADVTVDGVTASVKIELAGKKGLARIKFIEKLSGDDAVFAALPKSVGIDEVDNALILSLVKYYTSTQKANSNTNGGTSQTGNTYFAIGNEDYLTAFWNWTYSGDKVAIFKCSYTFNESSMVINLTADLANNGVEQWQYVSNKTFNVTAITVGDIPESIMSRVALYD